MDNNNFFEFLFCVALWVVFGLVAIMSSPPFYKSPQLNYLAMTFHTSLTVGLTLWLLGYCILEIKKGVFL